MGKDENTLDYLNWYKKFCRKQINTDKKYGVYHDIWEKRIAETEAKIKAYKLAEERIARELKC